MNSQDEPHVKRRGWLKNGNSPGDPSKSPRCGAKARHGGKCRAPAMKNGRCRLHGGKSTGPRTEIGLSHSRKANWRHGRFSADEIKHFEIAREVLRIAKVTLENIKKRNRIKI